MHGGKLFEKQLGLHKSVLDKLARRAGKPDCGGRELQHGEARQGDVQDHLRAACDRDQDRGPQLQGVLSGPEHRRDQDQPRLCDGPAQAGAGAEAGQHCGWHTSVQVTSLGAELRCKLSPRCDIRARPRAHRLDWYLNNKPLSAQLVQDGVLSLKFSPDLIGKLK